VKPLSFMLIAGEASGDALAAELVAALRERVVADYTDQTADVQPLRTALEPRFFGAGGPRMAKAGVELAVDMTQHSVIGFSDVLKNYFKFRRLFRQLFQLAIERQPDVIIGVDYGGFNLRFGRAIKDYVQKHRTEFTPWNPKLVQYVSPQVWASRPGRAYLLEDEWDLLLSIFPFEKDWYARRVSRLHVEFVGHPMLEKYTNDGLPFTRHESETASTANRKPHILLLPGSRESELQRHLPVILGALKLIAAKLPACQATLALPGEHLALLARSLGVPANVNIQVGNLPSSLALADVAIASTGTVTMECAYFGVPTVTLYKTSWSTYQIGKRIVSVKWLTMPNILAGEEVFPEFVQDAATPERVATAALDLLTNEGRREKVKTTLAKIVKSLGQPGANERAANAIVKLLE
jgi:lipid-A-disaccharide synthase